MSTRLRKGVILFLVISISFVFYQNFDFETFTSSASKAPPNLIVILLDDAGYEELMDPQITPRINEFRKEATFFPYFYTTPMCSPTRVSMLSGRNAADYSILWVCDSDAIFGIPNKDATIPTSLKSRGYHTAALGKWHASINSNNFYNAEKKIRISDVFPMAKEYDIESKFDFHMRTVSVMADGYFDPVLQFPNYVEKKYRENNVREHSEVLLASEVIKYLRGKSQEPSKKPFFMQYWLNAPHDPFQPDPAMIPDSEGEFKRSYLRYIEGDARVAGLARDEWAKANRVKLYRYLLKTADRQIGRVLDFINSSDEYLKNTVILITTDNGGTRLTRVGDSPWGNKDHLGRDMRGFKTDLYEGGIRQPLFVKIPGQRSTTVNNSMLHVMDIFPTLLDLSNSGSNANERGQLQGESFANVLRDPRITKARKAPLYWAFKAQNEGILKTDGFDIVNFVVRDGKWKFISAPYTPEEGSFGTKGCDPCLFEFANGHSNEHWSKNLAEKNPDLVKKYQELYVRWFLQATQIPLSVDTQSSAVRTTERTIAGLGTRMPQERVFDFEFPEGRQDQYVRFQNSLKFDINRLDFTVSATIFPKNLNKLPQVIAHRPGSWILQVNGARQLEVVFFSRDGKTYKVTSDQKMTENRYYNIAFNIHSFKKLESVVKIFATRYPNEGTAGGKFERLKVPAGKEKIPRGLMSNSNSIFVGAKPESNLNSFNGSILNIRMYHSPLRPEHITFGMRKWDFDSKSP